MRYSYATAGGSWSYKGMNHIPSSTSQGPKPGYRFVAGDSCYVLWSAFGPVNAWASVSCVGAVVVGNHNNQGTVPSEYSLAQNFPNPFNPSTNIKFELPISGHVKLTVFDLTGREISVLINESRQAGVYNVDFDASLFASGIYFYKLVAGDFTDTKKMLLIK